MDDSFARRFIEVPNGDTELCLRHFLVALGDYFSKLADFGPDAGLNASIPGSPLHILTVPLDCRWVTLCQDPSS